MRSYLTVADVIEAVEKQRGSETIIYKTPKEGIAAMWTEMELLRDMVATPTGRKKPTVDPAVREKAVYLAAVVVNFIMDGCGVPYVTKR